MSSLVFEVGKVIRECLTGQPLHGAFVAYKSQDTFFFILDEQVPLLIIFQMLVETEMCHQVLQLLD
jgi:hypothetical protein